MTKTQLREIEIAKKEGLSEEYISFMSHIKLKYVWQYQSLRKYLSHERNLTHEKGVEKIILEFRELYDLMNQYELFYKNIFNAILLASIPQKDKKEIITKKKKIDDIDSIACLKPYVDLFRNKFEFKDTAIRVFINGGSIPYLPQNYIDFFKKHLKSKNDERPVQHFFLQCMKNRIDLDQCIISPPLLLDLIYKYPFTEYKSILTNKKEAKKFYLNKSKVYSAIIRKLQKKTDNGGYTENTIDKKYIYKNYPTSVEDTYTIYKKTKKLCIVEKSGSINICLSSYGALYIVPKEHQTEIYQQNEQKKIRRKIVVFPNDTIFTETTRGNLIPITIKNISFLLLNYQEFSKFLAMFFTTRINENKFFKDLWDLLERKQCILPLKYNDINYYNFKDYFLHAFKKAKELNLNLNKHSPNYIYLIISATSKLDEKSVVSLLQWNRKKEDIFLNTFFESFHNYRVNNLVLHFIKALIAYNLGRPDITYLIEDYVWMSLHMKKKVSVLFQSEKALQRKHDICSIEYRNKYTSLIKVPKNSKYKELRKMLPKAEFEEIRTRKRIVEEGFIQHNCVASYAEFINHDKCAIYSFISPLDHKRYTLEFRVKKGKYFLRQAHCQYNKGCPNSVIKYIQSFLKQ